MTYHDLIRRMAKMSRDTNRPFAKDDVINFFDLLHDAILECVEEEEKLAIKGILKIETVTRKGKPGHYNVRTGETIELPSKKTVKISFMEDLKNECEKILNQ